jgi:outer membrane protein assembly factor BamB
MTRRDYVSFLGERRRDITFGNRGPDPTRWVLLIVAVLGIAVSVWWFGFRDVDRVIASERILNDTTVPTLLTPTALEGLGAEAAEVDLSCPGLVEEWTTFQGSPTRTGCVSTRMIVRPKILWSVETGILGWRNNPVIEDGSIFVGSAGVLQSAPDRRDGIYSIDLGSGTQRWFYTTELDVNSVAVKDGTVVGTGDEGRIWALSARDGSLLWTKDLEIAVFADPLFYGDVVVIADGAGVVRAYNLRSGNVVWNATVDGAVRGGVSSDGDRIYVAGENGEVLVLSGTGQIVWRASIQTRIAGSADARIFSAPTITDSMVIVSLVRNDIFGEPALVALDKEDGTEIWRGKDSAGIKTQWANIRSSPAVAGDYLIFGEGYSKDLVVMNVETGETAWSYQTPEFCYPHWPSVAVNSGPDTAQAYLARQDGAIYSVDLNTRELAWQIYLGDADGTGAFPASFGDGAFCQWAPTDGYSILASPAISPEGVIVIGTLEGYLMAIGDADW